MYNLIENLIIGLLFGIILSFFFIFLINQLYKKNRVEKDKSLDEILTENNSPIRIIINGQQILKHIENNINKIKDIYIKKESTEVYNILKKYIIIVSDDITAYERTKILFDYYLPEVDKSLNKYIEMEEKGNIDLSVIKTNTFNFLNNIKQALVNNGINNN